MLSLSAEEESWFSAGLGSFSGGAVSASPLFIALFVLSGVKPSPGASGASEGVSAGSEGVVGLESRVGVFWVVS